MIYSFVFVVFVKFLSGILCDVAVCGTRISI